MGWRRHIGYWFLPFHTLLVLSFVQVEVKKAEPRDNKAPGPGQLGANQWGPRAILSAANGWAAQPAQSWQQSYGPQGEWGRLSLPPGTWHSSMKKDTRGANCYLSLSLPPFWQHCLCHLFENQNVFIKSGSVTVFTVYTKQNFLNLFIFKGLLFTFCLSLRCLGVHRATIR